MGISLCVLSVYTCVSLSVYARVSVWCVLPTGPTTDPTWLMCRAPLSLPLTPCLALTAPFSASPHQQQRRDLSPWLRRGGQEHGPECQALAAQARCSHAGEVGPPSSPRCPRSMEPAGFRSRHCHPKGLLAPWPSGQPQGPGGLCPGSPPVWALSCLIRLPSLHSWPEVSFPGGPPSLPGSLADTWSLTAVLCASLVAESSCWVLEAGDSLMPHWAPRAWLQALAPRGTQGPPGIPFMSRPWSCCMCPGPAQR